MDGLEAGLGQLTGSLGTIGGLVDWELGLPAVGKLAVQKTLELGSELLVLTGVALEELVPLLLSSGTLRGVLVVGVVNLLWDIEGLGGVEAELLLELLDVVGLEGVTVNAVGTLKEGAEANGGGEADHGWLVLDLSALLDGSLNSGKIGVTVLDPLGVPAVGLESLGNVLSEGAVGVTVWLKVS